MYYFAYGTNMNLDQMRRICGRHFLVLGPASLPDYEFAADFRGFVSAAEKKGAKVLGVLYNVDQFCLDALDEFEGHPEVFRRTEALIADSSGQSLTAWIYIQPKERLGGKQLKEEHLKRIIAGATENHLPKEWIKFLESFR
jgi:gamma-glutamylcyclotransferase (GGCT)/AIG2-like uncharacterized protein YtfP